MLEKYIQARLKKKLEALGLLVLRAVNRSKSGYPDLEVFGQGRRMVFVEVKQDGEQLTALQQQRKKELEQLGHVVLVADNYTDYTVKSIVREIEVIKL